jgi:hypothetical protein
LSILTTIPASPGIDPLFIGTAVATLSNSNKTATIYNGSPYEIMIGTTARYAGKRYWECTCSETNYARPGVVGVAGHLPGNTSGRLGVRLGEIGWDANGNVVSNNASIGTVNTWNNASRMCVAIDLDNAKIWFRVVAGNWNNSAPANPATNVGGIDLIIPLLVGTAMYLVWPAIGAGTLCTLVMYQLAADFTQAVPTGFSAWGAA